MVRYTSNNDNGKAVATSHRFHASLYTLRHVFRCLLLVLLDRSALKKWILLVGYFTHPGCSSSTEVGRAVPAQLLASREVASRIVWLPTRGSLFIFPDPRLDESSLLLLQRTRMHASAMHWGPSLPKVDVDGTRHMQQ